MVSENDLRRLEEYERYEELKELVRAARAVAKISVEPSIENDYTEVIMHLSRAKDDAARYKKAHDDLKELVNTIGKKAANLDKEIKGISEEVWSQMKTMRKIGPVRNTHMRDVYKDILEIIENLRKLTALEGFAGTLR